VDALVARGNVTVLDDLSSGTTDNLNGRAQLINGSVLDTSAIDRAVQGADCVFHLAAWGQVPLSIEDPVGTHQVNVAGTLNVLEAVRRYEVPRLVYVSSSSVYGNQATHLLHEDMTPDPLSPYGLQKLIGEQYCTLYARMFGITIASLRYFNVYGPRQVAEGPYTLIVARFRQQRDADEPITIYGDGLQTRSYTYIDDVVRATVSASVADIPASRNTILNIGSDEETSVLEIARLTGGEVKHIYPNPRGPFEEHRKVADYGRASSLLGWQPVVPFRTGVALTYPE
jgi:UDP-glucose 4-epimerase